MLDSYCVIQFKNKEEREKILAYLAVETEAEYKVTRDLKNFVAEKYNVTITEKGTVNYESTPDNSLFGFSGASTFQTSENIAASSISTRNFSDKAPSAILNPPISDGTQDQHRDPTAYPSTTPEPIHVDQFHPVTDNSRTSMTTGDYGRHFLFSERPVERRHAIVKIRRNMREQTEVVTIDSSDNESTNDNVDSISSSSTAIGSSRGTKRRNHSKDDSDETIVPSSKQKRTSIQKSTRKKEKCIVCGIKVESNFSKKWDHVFKHTNIMRFECTIDGCESKGKFNNYNCKFKSHSKHPSRPHRFRELALSSEATNELTALLKECFNNTENINTDNCQICNQVFRKEHAYSHVTFIRFKCMEPGCSYKTKLKYSMKQHANRSHGKEKSSNFSTIQLTKEQEMEIEEVFGKCFPNLKQSQLSRIISETIVY